MKDALRRPSNITGIAAVFEGGLAILAVVVGLLVGHSPLTGIQWSREALPANGLAVLWGALAALPMLVGLLLLDQLPLRPFVRLQRYMRRLVAPLFSEATIVELALISLIAGIGEELLFRGLIQDGLAVWISGPTGVCIGLAVGSALFGLAHALTRTYAVLAAVVGLYLGVLLLLTGNVLAPVTAHAVYDFAALVYLRGSAGLEKRRPEKDNGDPAQ
jgi:membrane protease YdiL (CAAX protease family)